MRAKGRSREEQVSHVAQWKQSGLSGREYCHLHGLNYQTFRHWGKRKRSLAKGSGQMVANQTHTTSSPFIPVCVAPTAIHAQYQVLILQHDSGWRLSLPLTIDANWLGIVMHKLAQC